MLEDNTSVAVRKSDAEGMVPEMTVELPDDMTLIYSTFL